MSVDLTHKGLMEEDDNDNKTKNQPDAADYTM
jgi:hypothetical protein